MTELAVRDAVTALAQDVQVSEQGGVLIELGPHLGRYWPYVAVHRDKLQTVIDLCAPDAPSLPSRGDHPWNHERTDDLSQ